MPTIHIIENKTLAEKMKKTVSDPSFYRLCKSDTPTVKMGV